MRRSLIVDLSARLIILSAITLSIYLLAAGHNQPGGGFIGGLVGGAAIAFAYVAGALPDVRRLLPVQPWTVLGLGLAVAVAAAIIPVAIGHSVLEQGYTTFHPPLLGDVKVTSALVFDTGVYLVVLGVVLMAFEALGEQDAPEHPEGLE